MQKLIEIKNIFKIYNTGYAKVYALSDVSLNINRGDFTAIIGKSGSGKSTLMNILGCLDVPTSGKYFLDGEEVSELSERKLSYIRNKVIGFIFQSFNLVPTMTALENVELPLIYRKTEKKKRHTLAVSALEMVGLSERMNHRPFELSGGQQQRVAIARALVNNPKIILADEPTGALDSKSTDEMLGIFSRINQKGQTIVMVTHSVKAASRAGRVLFIKDGEVFHQVYRGELSDEQFYQKISATLTMLATGGERR